MTEKEMRLQESVLKKYRTSGLIPSAIEVRKATSISTNTVYAFMEGCSANETLRSFIKDRLTKNLEPLPDDVVMLFAVWEKDRN